MAKHNNMIPNNHFHKDWQRMVKTWFNQPARKARRRQNRLKKAAKMAPRPTKPLRPIVNCPGIRYNMKERLGRGFTLKELSAVGMNQHYARSIGIAVDHRRINKSVESLQRNVQRLKEYKSRLILFPLNKKKPRKDEATLAQWKLAVQKRGPVMPVKRKQATKHVEGEMTVTKKMNAFDPWRFQKRARAYIRRAGRREKKQKAAADTV